MNIDHAVNAQQAARSIRDEQGRPPCFDRPRCSPGQYEGCHWKQQCGARLEMVRGVVLSRNVIIGHQVASLFASSYGWRLQVLEQDMRACDLILQGDVDAVIADIDDVDLGGLAVLAYARHHEPTIMTYAITEDKNPYTKRLALELGGCLGFIHRVRGKMALDTRSGLVPRLLPHRHRDEPEAPHASTTR